MATDIALDVANRLWNWRPHSDGQREWILSQAPIKVASCGRRWGKSESTAIDCALFSLERPGSIQIVMAPTSDQTRIIMEEVSRRLHGCPGLSGCIIERKTPHHTIRFRDGGKDRQPTTITARTLGLTGSGLRGHKCHRAIIDEAAFVPAGIIERVVFPMLADYDGQLVMVSTPNGRDLFWRIWQEGQDWEQSRVRSFRFPSSSNPYISQAFLENERISRPERIWRAEYEAAFIEDGGQVFRRVREAVRADDPVRGIGHSYVAGVDWGRTNDFTVVTVMDALTHEVMAIDRFNQVDYSLQLARLQGVFNQWQMTTIVAEANSMGQPLVEQLMRLGLPVQPFTTSNASKAQVIESLALELEQGLVVLPNYEPLLLELEAFGMERLPSGLIRYSAPDGIHDDCVMSLALALYACGQRVSYAPSIWR